jgi:hypothetical protein
MGNRTYLTFGTRCEFDANNCLPVTWLALFEEPEFRVEMRRFEEGNEEDYEENEENEVAVYQTSQPIALKRADATIDKLKDHTPIWSYLRPLEILRNELKCCASDTVIELNVTELWAKDEIFEQRVSQAPAAFKEMLNSVTGEEEEDLRLLTELVNRFNIGKIASMVELDSDGKMFVLIGSYSGEEEDLYSFGYFDKAYWIANG